MRHFVYCAISLAAMALSTGCTTELGGGESRAKTPDISLDMTTIDPRVVTHGDLPLARGDNYGFNPRYDVLVFLRLTPSGKIFSRIHHFKANGPDVDSTRQTMAAAIAFLRIPANADKLPPGSLNENVMRSLGNMAFSAQSNVVVFVDNADLKFRSIPVFFTSKLRDGTRATENYAFYDSNPFDLTITENGMLRQVPAVYLRNYFTKGEQGNEDIATSDNLRYSFNFNLDATDADDSNRKYQFIVDPDGGNMGSGGPPP